MTTPTFTTQGLGIPGLGVPEPGGKGHRCPLVREDRVQLRTHHRPPADHLARVSSPLGEWGGEDMGLRAGGPPGEIPRVPGQRDRRSRWLPTPVVSGQDSQPSPWHCSHFVYLCAPLPSAPGSSGMVGASPFWAQRSARP